MKTTAGGEPASQFAGALLLANKRELSSLGCGRASKNKAGTRLSIQNAPARLCTFGGGSSSSLLPRGSKFNKSLSASSLISRCFPPVPHFPWSSRDQKPALRVEYRSPSLPMLWPDDEATRRYREAMIRTFQTQSRLMRYICEVDEDLGCRRLAARARCKQLGRSFQELLACGRPASASFALKAEV